MKRFFARDSLFIIRDSGSLIQLPLEELKKQLVETGAIREADFDLALKDAKRTGQGLVDILISRQFIDEEYYINLVSKYYNIPPAEKVAPSRLAPEILHLIPEEVARKKRALVFAKEDNVYHVAMEDPNDLSAIEFLEKYLKGTVKPYIATERFLNKGYAAYSQESTINFIHVIEENIKETERRKVQGLEEAAVDIPIVSIVDNLVAYGMATNASDIHIEVMEGVVIIRFRIDGIMREMMRISPSVHPSIVARIKLLAGLRIDEHARPQDGRFRYKAAGEFVDIRVAVMPTFHGEKVVMRLLRATTKPLSFAELGMLDDTEEVIQEALKHSYGIILVTGPTGSGKTTTIYSMVDVLNRPEVNIVTVEDPVEYDMRYVNQTQVNEQAGITFAGALRAFLRQDPNIILVGEIRDEETADIAVNAALTGHLVLASLHTNDAPTAVPRLIDMGVEKFLVSAVMNIVIAQRLVRQVCRDCIVSHEPEEGLVKAAQEQLNMIGSKKEMPSSFYHGKGCSLCSDTGYRGRIAIFEIAQIGPDIRNLISNEDFTLDRMRTMLRERGMQTMLEDGIRKVEQGQTTLEELIRVIRE